MTKSMQPLTPRNPVLDLLKAFLIGLSCVEHFSGILNSWYIDRFGIRDLENSFRIPGIVDGYSHHYFKLGTPLPADSIQAAFHQWLIPWLPHLYIALAAFNLGRKPLARHAKNEKYFFVLFSLFVLENFLVAPDFGAAISINPILIWMIVLGILYWICARFSLRAITWIYLTGYALQVIQCFWKNISIPSIFEILAKIHPWTFHTDFIPYFLSGLLGFLTYKWLDFIQPHKKLKYLLLAASFALSVCSFILSIDLFVYDNAHVFNSHDRVHPSPIGFLFITSTLFFILCWVHSYESQKTPSGFRLATYISTNSLGIFLTHRVFFLKFIAPLRLHLGSYFGLAMTNTWFELLIYFALSVLLFEGLRRARVFGELIARAE